MTRCDVCGSRLVVVDQKRYVRIWACGHIRLNYTVDLDKHSVYYECRKCGEDVETCGHGHQ